VDPAHLARTFRAHYRCSIGDFVRRLRVERASCELTDTDTPMADIALGLGFFDQSHFSRVFKDQTGLTPTEFRAASRPRHSRANPHVTS
jgi:AraC family transcriptional regulator